MKDTFIFVAVIVAVTSGTAGGLYRSEYCGVKPGQVWRYQPGRNNPFEERRYWTNTVLDVRGRYVQFINHFGQINSTLISVFKHGSTKISDCPVTVSSNTVPKVQLWIEIPWTTNQSITVTNNTVWWEATL
jgi:hypothetical protein